MKTLVIVAHPNLQESRLNAALMKTAEAVKTVTVHDLYARYTHADAIDVEKEQQLLLEHDRIVFQFPFYWYSSPGLLKEWQDRVLTYGFAYGSEGTALKGKQFKIATTTGGPTDAYQAGGYNGYTLSELLRPFQAMANLTGMHYSTVFTLGQAYQVSDEALLETAISYRELLSAPW